MKIKILETPVDKTFVFPTTKFFYRISLRVTREDFLKSSNEIIDEWNTSCLDKNNNDNNSKSNNNNKDNSCKDNNNNNNNDNNNTINDDNGNNTNTNNNTNFYNPDEKGNEEIERAIRCLKKLSEELENEIGCHELLSEWNPILDGCKFWVEGVAVCVIGVFGLCGNTLAIVALGNNKVANK
jgi:hypothetical protein